MNLLTDPLFRVETPSGLEWLDLPGLLEALGGDRVEALPGVQRHQEDAVHIFLCYLAGAVLAREGRADPRQSTDFWRDAIRRLTVSDGGADDSAWTLVVDDPTLPAFMQAPCPTAADFAAFKPKANTPDALDLLPTAKNHDVKSRRAGNSNPEGWAYALISLQGMSGFFGKGNYGIARMNGGFGSRPLVALDATTSPADRWLDHTTRLLTLRPALLEGVWGYRDDGLVCTWVPPWDLRGSLALNRLDPFFLEICRPVRLVQSDERIQALGASSDAMRIEAKAANGVLGDPWIPVKAGKKDPAALTVSAYGLTPDLLRNLLFEDDFILTPLQRPGPGQRDRSCVFRASVMVRGQGTTDGLHQTEIPIPGTGAKRLFRCGPERDRLATLSKTALDDSGTMQNKVLKAAVFSLLEAGPAQVNFDKREVTAWWGQTQRAFTTDWSADYFPWLWRMAEHPDPEAARLEWLRALRAKAETALNSAIATYPTHAGRRYRAQVRAQGLFYGLLGKHFPVLMPPPAVTVGGENP